jgi:hypothetical protein
VWIVQATIYFATSTNAINLSSIHWGVKAYSAGNSWTLGGGTQVCWNYENQTIQQYYNGATTTLQLTGVHVVGATTNYLNLGHYIAYSNNISNVGGDMTATRIA